MEEASAEGASILVEDFDKVIGNSFRHCWGLKLRSSVAADGLFDVLVRAHPPGWLPGGEF